MMADSSPVSHWSGALELRTALPGGRFSSRTAHAAEARGKVPHRLEPEPKGSLQSTITPTSPALERNKHPSPESTEPAGRQYLTPVILATQEAEIRKIEVQSQPRKIVHETLSQKYPT
jgi:hypothetical protein